jgi:hypothetical protein
MPNPPQLGSARRNRLGPAQGNPQGLVVNLRGANGSGKSYLVRRWAAAKGWGLVYPRSSNLLGGTTAIGHAEYSVLGDGGWLIGDYRRDCGGCDTIHTQDEVRARVLKGRAEGARYVLFEGVIISTVYEYWHQFSQTVGGTLWVYLDTPVEVCLKRVYERNRGKQINDQLVRNKVRGIESTRLKAVAAGERVEVLHWERAFEEFSALMERYA